jgi:hypothetical protein
MELTQEHLEVASGAYIASLDGKGVIVANHCYPVAHDLCEQGWLRREFVPDPENGDSDELAWFWTPAAEHALDVNALLQGAQGREN